MKLKNIGEIKKEERGKMKGIQKNIP